MQQPPRRGRVGAATLPQVDSVQRTRRDRHGRGLRGPLVPPGVPLARSRAEQFDDLVLDAVEHLEEHWGDQLSSVEFAVEEVPPAGLAAGAPDVVADEGDVPLSRLIAAEGGEPARIVLYRRPLEVRSTDRADLGDLVHDVVVEQVARLLGLDPEAVDPPYGEE